MAADLTHRTMTEIDWRKPFWVTALCGLAVNLHKAMLDLHIPLLSITPPEWLVSWSLVAAQVGGAAAGITTTITFYYKHQAKLTAWRRRRFKRLGRWWGAKTDEMRLFYIVCLCALMAFLLTFATIFF